MSNNPFIDLERIKKLAATFVVYQGMERDLGSCIDNVGQHCLYPLSYVVQGKAPPEPYNDFFNAEFWEKFKESTSAIGKKDQENLQWFHGHTITNLGTTNIFGRAPVHGSTLNKNEIQQVYSLLYHLHNPSNIHGNERALIERMFAILDIGEILSEEEILKQARSILSIAQNKRQEVNAPRF